MVLGRMLIGLWLGTMAVMAVIFSATVILWQLGDMADHGMVRTLSWSGLAIILLAFQYPRKQR